MIAIGRKRKRIKSVVFDRDRFAEEAAKLFPGLSRMDTYKAMAERTGISEYTIRALFTRRRNPSIGNAVILADTFGIEVYELLVLDISEED